MHWFKGPEWLQWSKEKWPECEVVYIPKQSKSQVNSFFTAVANENKKKSKVKETTVKLRTLSLTKLDSNMKVIEVTHY